MPPKPLIAVDGPAASGKGTIARALASHFGIPHMDTGALYRATALATRRAGDDADSAQIAARLPLALLDDPAIRSDEIGQLASTIAANPQVRAALLQLQQQFAARPEGAVLDGRDIGTVIAPDAPAKLFVTARPEVRAQRRWRELVAAGARVSEAETLAAILARDENDRKRTVAPLQKATDADLLDTSDIDIETAVRLAVGMVSDRLNQAS